MSRLLVSLVLIALATSVALARPTVAILGLEVTGEVDQPSTAAARDLTDGLRARAKVANGPYTLAPNSQRELIDEKVLKDCGDEAPACMAAIGRDLGAAVLVFGRLEKVAGGGYRVTLTALDVADQAVLGREVVDVPARARGSKLRGIAKQAYARLVGGIASAATLVVTANVERGTVYVDDEPHQPLKEGRARLSLPPGRYRIAVEADGYRRQELTVKLDEAATVTQALTLRSAADGDGDGSRGFDPWKPAFAATAVARVGLAIYSTYAYTKMKDLEGSLPPGASDNDCGAEVTGAVAQACSYHDKHALTAYAAIGTGALMLVSGYFAFVHDKGGSERAPARPAMAIAPHVSPSGGGAVLHLTW